MAWSKYQIGIAFVMVITGSINTLSTNWADISKSKGSAGQYCKFNHPFLQSAGMFLGELSCLLAFHILLCHSKKKNINLEIGPQTFSPFIFWLPAICDVFATSIMYIGLTLTSASSFQMLRGALIIFTGLFSVVFLKRKLKIFNWVGMFLILLGLIVVGLSDALLGGKSSSDSSDFNNTSNISCGAINETSSKMGEVVGDVLIIGAQMIAATQMILEEKFISQHDVPPLQVVGWEGLFGLFSTIVLITILNFIYADSPFGKPPYGRLEDPVDGFVQIGNSTSILFAILGNIISIAFFNFAGITVTKELSATTRTILDSIRTLVIWMVSLALGWQSFTYLQPVGFILLIIGMFVYNDVIFRPYLIKKQWISGSQSGLITDDDLLIQNHDNEHKVI